MHSTPHHPRHRWDGSRTNARPHRSLRLAAEPGTPLLRAGQTGRCRDCGNLIEWYHRPDHRPVPLHPKELPADFVPESDRWSVAAGIAYAAGDGTPWCRVPHAALCPARTSEPPTKQLAALRRTMAAHTRRLIDTGRFTPQRPEPARHHSNQPTRPVFQILGIRYLAGHQVQDIQCLARSSSTRARCQQRLADPAGPPGTWRLLPVAVTPSRQMALPAESEMAVYDLTGLPYADQLRWRAQRCRHHTAARAEMGPSDWEPFDPLVHHEHIRTELPDLAPRRSQTTSRCHYT